MTAFEKLCEIVAKLRAPGVLHRVGAADGVVPPRRRRQPRDQGDPVRPAVAAPDRGTGAPVPRRLERRHDAKERREFLKQVWTLYLDLNLWPWRLFKFLVTGALGILPDVAVLNLVVRAFGGSPTQGAVAGWFVAMTGNYTVNRIWTFRAQQLPIVSSYLR